MHDEAGKNPAHHSGGQQDDRESPDLAALALDALDEPDADAARRAIQAAPDARRTHAQYEHVVGLLGTAVPHTPPGPELRDRILAATAPALPINLDAERRSRRSPALIFGSVAAILLIALLGVIAVNQWSTANERADAIDSLEAQVEAQDARIAELEVAARSAGAYVNFEQPLVWTPLQITDGPAGASGHLVHTPDGETAYLVITGMELDAAHVLQAWLIEDAPIPVGTMRTDGSGMGFLILQQTGEPLQDFSILGVTLEPPGGSPQPTSDPIMVAEIA